VERYKSCGLCGRIPPCANDAHPIDGIEMQYCRIDKNGSVEPCDLEDKPHMISVYYHLKNAGVDCVADFPMFRRDLAEEYAEFLAEKHNVEVDYC
jgi:hypothetical protein